MHTHKHTAVLLEGMALICLLHSLQHRLVDSEADGCRERSQGKVCHHTDYAELSQGEKQQQYTAKNQPTLLKVPPVQQLHRWVERERA